MPRERFNTISQGLFYSKLIYCLQVIGNVWGLSANDETNRRYTAFTKEDNRKLQTLQNQVLRLKTGLSRYTPTHTLISASGDLSVQQLTAFHTLTSVQKIIHAGKPKYLSEKLKQNSNPTRQGNTIEAISNSNLTLTRGAFLYRGTTLFNMLPMELRTRMKPEVFKPKVKTWIRRTVQPRPT